MYNWLLWGSLAAIGTSIWNLTLLNTPKTILNDPHIKSIYLRMIIIIAGLLSLISLFLPSIGLTSSYYKIIKKNITPWYLIWSGICLAGYQLLLIYAFSSGGTLAQAMVNLNIILMVIYGSLFMKQKTDIILWSMLIFYTIAGIGINYYNSHILAK